MFTVNYTVHQGLLDKAQQLNTSAREVFEFVARCCRCVGNAGDDGGVVGAVGAEGNDVGCGGGAGSSGAGVASDSVEAAAIVKAKEDLGGTVAETRAVEQARLCLGCTVPLCMCGAQVSTLAPLIRCCWPFLSLPPSLSLSLSRCCFLCVLAAPLHVMHLRCNFCSAAVRIDSV